MPDCLHMAEVKDVAPQADGCQECLRQGATWTRLRMCRTCGYVGCCDTSKGKHATAHFRDSGHPVMRTIEPGEDWSWCYVHNQLIIADLED